MNNQFLADVIEGLSKEQKTLPSKYFYDEKGDDLFTQIMRMPEYYLTRSEFEILEHKSEDIIKSLQVSPNQHFELIELGAGDGYKTELLLRKLIELGYDFTYIPIDISQNALDLLSNRLKEAMPSLKVDAQQGDFFERIKALYSSNHQKVLMFLGSTLGNMSDENAARFLERIGRNLKPEEYLILGVDLIKSKDVVLPAYNDPQKITASFNLNLLHRMNRELNANFSIDDFEHQAEYTEEEGIAKSYLVSKVNQTVTFDGRNEIAFKSDERIHTEISRKYNDQVLNNILKDSKLNIIDKFTDQKEYFADYVLQVQS